MSEDNKTTQLFSNIATLFKTEPITYTAQISPNQNKKRKRKRRSLHQGYFDGIWLDSGWECAYLIYHIDHKINIIRNTYKFPYHYNNRIRHYIPDFYLPDEDIYVEIKGKEPKICFAKYTALPKDKLKILYGIDMKPYLKYVIDKYGKKYWKILSETP